MESIWKRFCKLINKLFIAKTDNTLIQGFRYLFAGAAGFITDFSILFILTNYLHIYYLISATISFTLGVFVTYIISIYWVFQQKSHHKRLIEFILFVVIGVIGLILTLILLWFLTEKTHIYYLLSKIIATIIVYFWNFFARKWLLFGPPEIQNAV